MFDQLATPQGQDTATAQPAASTSPVTPSPTAAAQPQSQQPSQGQGDIFDQLSSGASDTQLMQPQPSQAAQSSTATLPTGTVSATPGSMPGDSLPSKITLWAQNLRNDLIHGTESTDIGRLYKSIGGQPLAAGQGEGVAEFMGSPILGPLRVIQGQSELPQSGKRWQGVKDTIGGLLDASTIPGGFIAPGEAGELAGQGADAVLTQAGRAANAVRKPFRMP